MRTAQGKQQAGYEISDDMVKSVEIEMTVIKDERRAFKNLGPPASG